MTSSRKLDLILVEDDAAFRDRFCHFVEQASDMRIVASAASVQTAIACLEAHRPDVLLVDLGLPDGNGIDVIRYAVAKYPDCDILVVTVFGDQRNVLASIEAGASGYILKDDLREDFVQRIQDLRAGGSPISPIIARQLLAKFQPVKAVAAPPTDPLERITERELEVLQLLARGFNYQEIANLLAVSGHTVGTYIKRIYRKLQVNSRSEAVFEARKIGILS